MEPLNYTIGLALEDFLTVIFFAAGLFYISRMAVQLDQLSSRVILLGGALITLGGISQAVWKLVVAVVGTNLVWLDNVQFILMMPGFVLLAAGLGTAWRRDRVGPPSRKSYLRPALYIVAGFASAAYLAAVQDGRAWFFLLLGLTTIFTVYINVALFRVAWKSGDRLAAVLFLVNLLLVFAAAGLARALGDDISSQWIKQITNNISYLAFAVAAFRVAR